MTGVSSLQRELRQRRPFVSATHEVADRMVEQTPGVTRLLDRLEAKELVRRQRCPKDRRQHLCWITSKGLDVLEKIDGVAPRANEESLKGLNQKDRVTF